MNVENATLSVLMFTLPWSWSVSGHVFQIHILLPVSSLFGNRSKQYQEFSHYFRATLSPVDVEACSQLLLGYKNLSIDSNFFWGFRE